MQSCIERIVNCNINSYPGTVFDGLYVIDPGLIPNEGGCVVAWLHVDCFAAPVFREVESGVWVVVDLESVCSRRDVVEVEIAA